MLCKMQEQRMFAAEGYLIGDLLKRAILCSCISCRGLV